MVDASTLTETAVADGAVNERAEQSQDTVEIVTAMVDVDVREV